jgi:hypothetical protein
LGQLGPACSRGEEKEEEGLLAWEWLRAKREEREREMGRLEKRKREGEGEGKGFSFFLLNFLFKFVFQTFKQNPCIRIMMHKHLLFLNYFSDV